MPRHLPGWVGASAAGERFSDRQPDRFVDESTETFDDNGYLGAGVAFGHVDGQVLVSVPDATSR